MKAFYSFYLTLIASSTVLAADSQPAVLALFEKHCSECHSEGDEEPALTAGINLVSLLGNEDLVKALLDRTTRADESKGRMPKSKGKAGDPAYTAPLSAEEIATLQSWAKGETKAVPMTTAATPPSTSPSAAPPSASTAAVAEGLPKAPPAAPAVRAFIPLRDEVRAIALDIAKVDASLQPTTRYLTFTNLHNLRDAKGQPTESDDQLDTYRAALSKLLNSLSHAGRITVPVPIDAAKTLFRIDLRDYALTAGDWEDHVVRGYPYALRGIDSRSEDDIANYTQSAVAYVRADWFTFAASQPPLYHDLLKLPHTEPELEQQQGVDTVANLRAGRALRAGFRLSGVSQGNRLIERHEAANGMYWKSYDFTPLVQDGGHDLFRSPLGPVGAGLTRNSDREFKHDGGEIIFALPNGLHGYLLATSDGKRIDRGPTEIVQDKKRRDGTIINGMSCMACHDQGMKYTLDQPTIDKMVDEVGPVALKAGLDRDELHAVQDLYASAGQLHAVVQADEAKFKAALALAIPGYKQAFDPVSRLYNRFKEDIRLETLAAEFGELDATFIQRLKDTRNADLESIAAQFESGLGFPRASWLEQFQLIARALGYHLQDYQPIAYAEFTSGAAKAGGHEGKVILSDGGRLTIATDKAHYKKGELLSVKLKSTEGVYVRLYHLSAEKVVTQIFPNAGRTNNFIKGGETVTLPGPGDKFRFRMKDPFGTEIILAVASPVQFADKDNLNFAQGEVFKSFGKVDLRVASQRGTKGLQVEVADAQGKVIGQRSAPTFTARAVFTVGPQ